MKPLPQKIVAEKDNLKRTLEEVIRKIGENPNNAQIIMLEIQLRQVIALESIAETLLNIDVSLAEDLEDSEDEG